jgi:uncharacterized protein (DUF488 family)
MKELFTIGHSNHPIGAFLDLLKAHRIGVVADVRSSPYSRFAPHFNRETLRKTLKEAGVKYVFLGDELGARRSEERCYVDGQAKYERIAELSIFQEGLYRLLRGVEKYRVAVMCSEGDPITCHRTILVCRELEKSHPELRIAHILRDGTLEFHEDAEKRLLRLHNLTQPALFGVLASDAGLVEKAYALQAERIAYKRATVRA